MFASAQVPLYNIGSNDCLFRDKLAYSKIRHRKNPTFKKNVVSHPGQEATHGLLIYLEPCEIKRGANPIKQVLEKCAFRVKHLR